MISIDEPDPSNYYSGSTAAPIAKELYQDIFRYLDIQPDTKDINNPKVARETIVPEIRGLSISDAEKALSNNKLSYEVSGKGNIIYDMSPMPGVSVKENTKVTLYLGLEDNKNKKIAVPDFTGMTKKEVTELANSLGIKISFMGDGIVVSQDIEPGTEAEKNKEVRVMLEEPQD
jgi:stage V sporulation protein D (sporulation-specific penicillin-binding protein)